MMLRLFSMTKTADMRKVVGIGETVLDIIFNADNQPQRANPGGSVFNSLISLGRNNVPCLFISEVGTDNVGEIICKFLTDNGVSTECIYHHEGTKSPLALAFLDENKNAQYSFYKDYKSQELKVLFPTINKDDIVLFGSFFALNPVIRKPVKEFLEYAHNQGAILYYDVNFRATHKHEVNELMSTLTENFNLATIVKGSDEDFENMFSTKDWREAYHKHIEPHCKTFICTQGAKGATVMSAQEERHVEGKPLTPVSTVGAGDSFNAGTTYGIYTNDIRMADIDNIDKLAEAMRHGIDFASEVCQSLENYVAKR